MVLWVIFAVSLLVFILSYIQNKRAFRNVFLTLISLFLFIIAAGGTANRSPLGVIIIFIVVISGICMLIAPFVFVWAGIVSIKREGLSLPHCLSIIFGVGMWGAFLFIIYAITVYSESTIFMCLIALVAIILCYTLFTFVGFLLYSELCLIMPKNPRCDFVIIHGAGLLKNGEVSPLLKARLEKGIEVFRKSGPDTRLIVSGGQGSDEKVTEAAAMKKYLLSREISEDKILMEDRSATTWENLKFSKELMDKEKQEYRALFVTNNYHVFRAGIYARALGIKADGIGCRTALYYWPNAFIREYIAIIIRQKAMPIFLFVMWAIFSLISLAPFN